MGLIGRLPIRQPTGKGIQVLDRKRSDRIMLYRHPGMRYIRPLSVRNEKLEVRLNKIRAGTGRGNQIADGAWQ